MEFRVIDDLLRNLIRHIYGVYRESYVRKQYRVPVNYPTYKTLRILHYEYKMTGEPVRIQHVAALIDRTPCQILDSMLKFFSTYGFHPPPYFMNAPNQNVAPSAPPLEETHEQEEIDDNETVKAHSGSDKDVGDLEEVDYEPMQKGAEEESRIDDVVV